MAKKKDYMLHYYPAPVGRPDLDGVSSVEPMLPGARYYLEHGMKIGEGDKVIVVNDSKIGDPLILEAWVTAARDLGAIVDAITLELAQHRIPPVKGPLGSAAKSWAPIWLDNAIMDADATVVLSPLNVNHGIQRSYVEDKWNAGRIGVPGNVYTRQQLAFTDWTTYPVELDVGIQQGLYKKTNVDDGPKEFHITCPLGTDVTFTQDIDRDLVRERFPYDLNKIEVSLTKRTEYMFHHNKISPGLSTTPDAEGTIVATSLASGPIEPMTLHLEKGQIVKIEGDGPDVGIWQENIDQMADIDYGYPHGRGVNWMTGVYIGTHPKIVRPDYFDPDFFEKQGTHNYWWCDIKRAGFIHIGFTKGWAGLDGMDGDTPVWHSDVFLPYTSVEVNGEPLIDKGHLCVLDDPEIREIAASVGDPDQLLTEHWIPPYDNDPSIRGHYSREDYAAIAQALNQTPS